MSISSTNTSSTKIGGGGSSLKKSTNTKSSSLKKAGGGGKIKSSNIKQASRPSGGQLPNGPADRVTLSQEQSGANKGSVPNFKNSFGGDKAPMSLEEMLRGPGSDHPSYRERAAASEARKEAGIREDAWTAASAALNEPVAPTAPAAPIAAPSGPKVDESITLGGPKPPARPVVTPAPRVETPVDRSILKGGERKPKAEQVPYWHDLTEFQRLAKASEAGPLRQLCRLYRGPYLEGCYHDWAAPLRDELEHQAGQAHLNLVEILQREGNYEEAVEVGQSALRVQPHRSEHYEGLMRAHLALGHPAAAIELYRRCEQTFRRDHETEPSVEMTRLYLQARSF